MPQCTGGPFATWAPSRDTDASYKRILDWCPARAHRRGAIIRQPVTTCSTSLGLATRQKQHAGGTRVEFNTSRHGGRAGGCREGAMSTDLLLYTRSVHPGEFDSAISYLIHYQ
jgi:hypothetical protein